MYYIIEILKKIIESELEPKIPVHLNIIPSNSILEERKISKSEIFISDEGFTLDRMGIGNIDGNLKKNEIKDVFDGDGEKSVFKLSKKPVKPLIAVEHPENTIKKINKEYAIDYNLNTVKFFNSPKKGKKNIIIRYYPLDTPVNQIFSIRLKINCIMDVLSSNPKECDDITTKIIQILLLNEEKISKEGIHLNFVRSGNNTIQLTHKNPNNIQILYNRRLAYDLETSIRIDSHVPVIGKIILQEDKFNS